MAPPIPPDDGKYHPSPGDSTSAGVTDIFNLPRGVGDTKVAVGTTVTPGTNLVGAKAPGLHTSVFGQANDVGAGHQPDAIAIDSIRNILEENVRAAASDPAKFMALQQQLFDAGFYGSAKTIPHMGSWSNETKNALVDALLTSAQAQQAGIDKGLPSNTFDEFLSDRAAKGRQQRDAEAAASPQFAQYTDPAAVAQTAQQAAEAAIGRRLNNAEIAKFQTFFKGQEGNYNAQQLWGSEKNGQPIQISRPDVGAEAEQFVDNNMTGEVGAQRGQQFIHALLGLVDVKGA